MASICHLSFYPEDRGTYSDAAWQNLNFPSLMWRVKKETPQDTSLMFFQIVTSILAPIFLFQVPFSPSTSSCSPTSVRFLPGFPHCLRLLSVSPGVQYLPRHVSQQARTYHIHFIQSRVMVAWREMAEPSLDTGLTLSLAPCGSKFHVLTGHSAKHWRAFFFLL